MGLTNSKKKTNGYINRVHEYHNADIAFNLGLAPKCLWRDNKGYSLSETVKQSCALEVAGLNNPERLTELVGALQKLHQSGQIFKGMVDITELLSRYYELMEKSKQELFFDIYNDATKKVKNVLKQFQTLVPSHNDLVLKNILLDSHNSSPRIWIIDWEYASMASPYWDLATLCNEGNFTAVQAGKLLSIYKNKGQSLDLRVLSDYRDILSALSIFWLAAFPN